MGLSNEAISERAANKAVIIIKNEIQLPDCAEKKQQAKWDRERALQLTIDKLTVQLSTINK